MAKYINADKFIEFLNVALPTSGHMEYYKCEVAVKNAIRQFPAADVVEVARCKDCIYKEQAYMQGWEDGRRELKEEKWEDGRDRLD